MTDSRTHGLLAVIAPRFTRELENVATESLAYLLEKSDHVESAFRGLASQITRVQLPERLTWRAQRGGEDHAIPDIVGVDSFDRQRVIVEGKFWAGLTQNQPGKYLERLRNQRERGVLLFIGPAMRTEVLWQEIRRACPAEIDLGNDEESPEGIRCATVLGHHRMALISWRAVIAALLSGAESARETDTVADLQQLQGLADRMDETAFLPLQPEELSERIPSRILQYKGLIDDAVHVLTRKEKNSHLALGRRRAAAGQGVFGVYISSRPPLIGLLYFSAVKWSKEGITPIWFQLTTPEGKCPPDVREKLNALKLERPRKVLEDDWGPTIPILLPTGVDRDRVVQAIVEEVTRILWVVVGSPEGPVGDEIAHAEAGSASTGMLGELPAESIDRP